MNEKDKTNPVSEIQPQKKLRLMLLSQYFHPEVGATQTRMREFAKHLTNLGHEVTVVCEFPNHPHGVIPEEYKGKWFETDTLDGFDVVRVRVKASPVKNFKTRLLFYLSYMVMAVLGGLKTKGRFDAVLATSPPLFVAISGWILSVLLRAKFVLDIRDIWPEAAVALGELSNPRIIRLAEKVERFLYRRADSITTVTKGFITHIAPRAKNAEKVHLIPNGTITDIFTPTRTDPELRTRLGLDGHFVLCFAGTMGIAQGLPFLLDLAKNLSKEEDDIRFLFIGTGPVRSDLEKKKEVEEISNVIFHDQVPLDQITEYLTMSDVLLVPLRSDPVFDTFIPSKMFDCLACKRPVILGVNGEARRMLETNGGGLYAEAENISSYKKAILTLKNDPALRDRMAEKGHKWVNEGYTRKAQTEALEKIIQDCVG